LSITDADVLCVVLRQLLLQEHQETAAPPDSLNQVPQETEAEKLQQAPPSQALPWMLIKGIMEHRRKKGKDYFLVAWEGSSQQDWIEKRFITDAALKHFYANKKPRRKRRRCY
jgi:hypothetical protein